MPSLLGFRRAPALVPALVLGLAATAGRAAAEGEDEANAPRSAVGRDPKAEVPVAAYAYTASGAARPSLGAFGYGQALGSATQRAVGTGGGVVWASPVERLTLVADVSYDSKNRFAPTFTAVVRVLGGPEGFSLGILGKGQKAGFGEEPKGTRDAPDELEPEVDLGLVLSYAQHGWHADLDAIGGVGTGDDADADGEARLRIGRDVGRFVRVGVDGEARARLAGRKTLVGGRTSDFAFGPQVLVGYERFFGSVMAGPATMNVDTGVGWTSFVSVGGVY